MTVQVSTWVALIRDALIIGQ